MTKVNKHKVALCAARSWLWYIDRNYACDLDYLPPLNKFVFMIGHHIDSEIPSCPLLQKYRYNISDEIVAPDWKMYIIDLFL